MKNRENGHSEIKKTLLIGCILFPILVFIIFIITNIWLIQYVYWTSPILYLIISVILVRKYVDMLDLELYAGISSKLLFLPIVLTSGSYLKNIYPQAILIMGPGYGFTTPIEAYILSRMNNILQIWSSIREKSSMAMDPLYIIFINHEYLRIYDIPC